MLICVGEKDIMTPLEAALELSNGIGGSTYKVFNKSGHSPFIEEQGEFERLVENWLH